MIVDVWWIVTEYAAKSTALKAKQAHSKRKDVSNVDQLDDIDETSVEN